ncbi:chaplin family protein [Streptomyces sp. NPDC101490]|uniref:chaplin family protein n=1 Tax=Streptomyces sp. NPDC101490 TaxID=3366143 RepID=UPI0038171F77
MTGVRDGVTVAPAVGAEATGGASTASADAGARGLAAPAHGAGPGHPVRASVHVPADARGNALGSVGARNPAFGAARVSA